MSVLGSIFHIVFMRLLPFLVLLFAIFLGWCNQLGVPPMGQFFAIAMPLFKGYKPPAIFGHGKMIGTPPVPDDMMPEPRPENELFLELPGGDKMPQNGIGMCCRPTAYDDVLVERTILWYLLMGGRHIDTAHLYLNHVPIGKGIKEAIHRGVPREEIFLTTKIWPGYFGYNTTKELVPKFLDELGVEYIDLLLMHAPATLFPNILPGGECSQLGLSKKECRQETWKALSDLREEGVIRNAGVSNFAAHHLQDLLEMDNVAPIAANQIQWHPWVLQEWVDAAELGHQHGIAITGYNSLGGSLQHHQTHTVEALTELAKKYDRTVAQVMLRWAMQTGAAVIPGTGNPKYMRENLSIYSFEITKEDMETITNLRDDDNSINLMSMKPVD